MLITTSDALSGSHAVEQTIGLVRGSSIRTRHIITDITEWLRNLVGAELHHYTKMLAECREQALDRMVEDARRIGADAIVSVQFETSNIAAGAAEILVYGTGVKIRRIDA